MFRNQHSAGAVGNYLRQLTVTGNESFALYRDRDAGNRGNAYLPPTIEYDKTVNKGIFPNFDCDPSGGEVGHSANPKQVACFVLTPLEFQGRGQGRFAHVEPNDYSAGASSAARR